VIVQRAISSTLVYDPPRQRIGVNNSKKLRVLRHWARGVAVYTITVRYSKHGMVAMNLKADTISLAREKALHMKSQAFHVEIKDALGQEFPLHAEE
jgi:hypothetical protein